MIALSPSLFAGGPSMYKTLCVVALLLATFVFTSGSKPADASPVTPVSPPIVAKGKLVNQTAPIPTTTIFTPTQVGLYRISVYMTLTKVDIASNSTWWFTMNWTDDGGAESAGNLVNLIDNQGPPQAYGIQQNGAMFGPVLSFESAAGTPVTYVVGQSGGSDNSAYSLYYTVERLE
jgi:hypothetical protein